MRFSGLAAQMLNDRLQLVKFPKGFQGSDYGVFQVALRLLMGLAKYGHGKIFRDAVKNSLFLPYSAQTGISTTISEDFFFLRKATTISPFDQPALVVYAASERFRHFARRPRNQPIAGFLQTAPRESAEIRG